MGLSGRMRLRKQRLRELAPPIGGAFCQRIRSLDAANLEGRPYMGSLRRTVRLAMCSNTTTMPDEDGRPNLS